MKKLLFVIVLLFAGAVNAQQLDFGAKAGVNFASLSGDDLDELDGRTGFHLGLVAEIGLSERFSIQPEILYSAQGAKLDEYELKLDYINVPVMAKYYVANGFSLEAGPQFGFNVKAEEDFDGETDDIDDVEFDLGVGVGAGYKMDMGLFFQARYNMSFTDIVEDGDAKNSVFQLSVGFMF